MEITVTPNAPDTNAPSSDPLEKSFDLVARQDQTDAAISALKTDVAEVKSRLDKVARAAGRPAISSGSAAQEVKGFVGGYLRYGQTSQVKSLNTSTLGDGGYAVPRVIDQSIARELSEISPIRSIANVVRTGTSGYRKLVSTGGTGSGWVHWGSAEKFDRRISTVDMWPDMTEYAEDLRYDTVFRHAAGSVAQVFSSSDYGTV